MQCMENCRIVLSGIGWGLGILEVLLSEAFFFPEFRLTAFRRLPWVLKGFEFLAFAITRELSVSDLLTGIHDREVAT